MTLMDMTNDRRICALITGTWGSGKSWLAQTMPGLKLVLDGENGVWDTPGPKHSWNMRDKLPELDPDTAVIVDVTSWDVAEEALSLLEYPDHPFDAVVIDSLTEIQLMCKRSLEDDPDALFSMPNWGRLLNRIGDRLRRLRDLARPSAARRIHTVIVAGADDEKVPIKPLLEGALRKRIAGWMDLEGYLKAGQDEQGRPQWTLQVAPSDFVEAKCRLHAVREHYGPKIVNPTLAEVVEVVNGRANSTV